MFFKTNHLAQKAGGVPIIFAVAVSVILGTVFFLGVKVQKQAPLQPNNIALAYLCSVAAVQACQAANPGYCDFSRCEYRNSRCDTPGVCYYGDHSSCAAAGIPCTLSSSNNYSCVSGACTFVGTGLGTYSNSTCGGSCSTSSGGGGINSGPQTPTSFAPPGECGDFTETTYPAFKGIESTAEGCNTSDSQYGVGPNKEKDWTVNNIRNHGLELGCVRGHYTDVTDGCYSGHTQCTTAQTLTNQKTYGVINSSNQLAQAQTCYNQNCPYCQFCQTPQGPCVPYINGCPGGSPPPPPGTTTCTFVCDIYWIDRYYTCDAWSCEKQCEFAGGKGTAYLWDSAVSKICGCGRPEAGTIPPPPPPPSTCTTDANCNDNNSCTTDHCNTTTGQCENTAVSGTHLACRSSICLAVANTATECTNQNACTAQGNSCAGTPPPPPPPSGQCPSISAGASTLKQYINTTFRVNFVDGQGVSWSAGSLYDFCAKMTDVSDTKFDTRIKNRGGTSIIVHYADSGCHAYTPNDVWVSKGCVDLRGSVITSFLFHELTHSFATSGDITGVKAAAIADKGLTNWNDSLHGHIAVYPYGIDSGQCVASGINTFSEEIAEDVSYFLHPSQPDHAPSFCTGLSGGKIAFAKHPPAHCAFTLNYIGPYNPDCP